MRRGSFTTVYAKLYTKHRIARMAVYPQNGLGDGQPGKLKAPLGGAFRSMRFGLFGRVDDRFFVVLRTVEEEVERHRRDRGQEDP